MRKLSLEIDKLEVHSNLRTLKDTQTEGKYIRYQNNKYLNTASNDYLGIASDSELQKEFLEKLAQNSSHVSFGGASSRLLTGNSSEYRKLESFLKFHYRKSGALVFNSGYNANIGILPALAGKRDLIFADKSVHASLIDGFRLSEAKFVRFKHCDYNHLETLLAKYAESYENIFIAAESVYSMSGNMANLPELVRLKNKYKAYLYIDEAHAFGVFGEKGLGLAEAQNCIDDIDILMGTFGKAAGSQGAFVVFNELFQKYLVNKMRPLIFTTALPPISLAWTLFTFQHLLKMNDKRKSLQKLSAELRAGIKNADKITGGHSQIVPYITGSNITCLRAAEKLSLNKVWAMPIRTPTVVEGNELVRFSLTANMDMDDVKLILSSI